MINCAISLDAMVYGVCDCVSLCACVRAHLQLSESKSFLRSINSHFVVAVESLMCHHHHDHI